MKKGASQEAIKSVCNSDSPKLPSRRSGPGLQLHTGHRRSGKGSWRESTGQGEGGRHRPWVDDATPGHWSSVDLAGEADEDPQGVARSLARLSVFSCTYARMQMTIVISDNPRPKPVLTHFRSPLAIGTRTYTRRHRAPSSIRLSEYASPATSVPGVHTSARTPVDMSSRSGVLLPAWVVYGMTIAQDSRELRRVPSSLSSPASSCTHAGIPR
ncbi:hypothetical protein LXA43DRAFT_1015338 [Ganoderma leucocontextum]|nr:hypothetical protein LXA43DRAFT_1015338 [Ganoderma leucocontextum]